MRRKKEFESEPRRIGDTSPPQPIPDGKSVRIFAFTNTFDIQSLEAREIICAKQKIFLLKKKIFSLENNFSFGADRFLYVRFIKKASSKRARSRACPGNAEPRTIPNIPTQEHGSTKPLRQIRTCRPPIPNRDASCGTPPSARTSCPCARSWHTDRWKSRRAE